MGKADEPVQTAADEAFDVLLEKGSPRGSIWYFEVVESSYFYHNWCIFVGSSGGY